MKGSKEQIISWLSEYDSGIFEIKEVKNKRSLSQNSFYWSLVNEIANKLGIDKEEMHLHLLKHYGQSEIIAIGKNVNVSSYLKYYEELYTSGECATYKVFKPSSQMNSYEMGLLLSGTINEAENVGIHTLKLDEVIKWKLN